MSKAIKKDTPWPVLVLVGSKHTIALMNNKAHQKSIENKTPWVIHPETGRLLPWPESPKMIRLEKIPSGYLLELPEDSNPQPYGVVLPQNVDPHNRDDVGKEAGLARREAETILTKLSKLIAERRQAMPEGSYTTHLFSSGIEKIRKKVGEEAVELILAQENKDIIYETADLIYHIQVLLESLNLKWLDVEAELHRRHSE